MKRITSVIVFLGVAIFPLSTRAEWAFITMLRGEPHATAPRQRVAFVGDATVKDVNGKVERLCGIDCWSAVSKGTTLHAGDLVRVENGSLVLKMTESQSFVKVTPGTLLHLLPLEQNWDRTILTGTEDKSGFIVRGCRGSASYRDEHGEWQPVRVNSVLPQTATLRTEAQSTVDLFCTTTHHAMRIHGAKELELAHANGTGTAAPTLASTAR